MKKCPIFLLLLALVAFGLAVQSCQVAPLTTTPQGGAGATPQGGAGATPIPPGRLLTPSYTPYTPQVMCTAPLCYDGETYYCSGNCPGGCGTGCATRTPDPASSPTPTFPPLESFCTLPQPGAGTPAPELPVCLSSTHLKVGETITLVAEGSEASYPEFILEFNQFESAVSARVRIRRDGATLDATRLTGSLALVSLRVVGPRLYVVLAGRSPGRTSIAPWALGGLQGPTLEVTVGQ